MMDVGSLVWRASKRYGADRIALDGPDGCVSFAQLGADVTRIARGLRALGLNEGDAVLDLQTNQNSSVKTDLAIRSAGLVRVALNYRLHPDDWIRIAQDSRARALIYDAKFATETEALRNGLDQVVVVGDGPGSPLVDLISRNSSGALPRLSMDTMCGLHYSSGTTGAPKGAERTHLNWWASLINMTHDVLMATPRQNDTFVHAGPITHTSGLFILPFLTAGARQILMPTWDVDGFVEAVLERGATHTALVPTMVARLLSQPEYDTHTFQNLKMLAYAGAPMPVEQVRQAYEQITPNLVQYYGLVEAIPPVTILDSADHRRGLETDPEILNSAGRAALGVELRIVDEDGRVCPPGEIGEVITRGDHVMSGYHNAEHRRDLGKTIHSGWLHTGDLGRMDESGHLWLIDRRGDMIISGGYNIYPREVEDVVAAVPGVDEVAVLGLPDPDWGQRVVALYTVRPGARVDEEDVLAHCRANMASYKKPKVARQLDVFPTNANGKISKKLLRAELQTSL